MRWMVPLLECGCMPGLVKKRPQKLVRRAPPSGTLVPSAAEGETLTDLVERSSRQRRKEASQDDLQWKHPFLGMAPSHHAERNRPAESVPAFHVDFAGF